MAFQINTSSNILNKDQLRHVLTGWTDAINRKQFIKITCIDFKENFVHVKLQEILLGSWSILAWLIDFLN